LTDHLARVPLAFLPTPLHDLPRLRESIGPNCPRVLIKRDDQTGLATGGNKTRKLEFVVADALAQDADVLVTEGGPQSNHCRQTSAAAAKLGLDCVVVLTGEEQPRSGWNGNLLLDDLLGATVVWAGDRERDTVMEGVAKDLQSKGRKPYVIPVGASVPLGSAGYVAAVEELAGQLAETEQSVDAFVFASGSAGTHAGILLGAKALGLDVSVEGIADGDDAVALRAKIDELVVGTIDLLGVDLTIANEDVVLHSTYGEPGYGVITAGEVEAMRLLATTEGIVSDPVYTGRALRGLFDLIDKGHFGPEDTVLFWHTGGSSGLFGRAGELIEP